MNNEPTWQVKRSLHDSNSRVGETLGKRSNCTHVWVTSGMIRKPDLLANVQAVAEQNKKISLKFWIEQGKRQRYLDLKINDLKFKMTRIQGNNSGLREIYFDPSQANCITFVSGLKLVQASKVRISPLHRGKDVAAGINLAQSISVVRSGLFQTAQQENSEHILRKSEHKPHTHVGTDGGNRVALTRRFSVGDFSLWFQNSTLFQRIFT